MNKKIATFLALMIILASCSSGTLSVPEYNEKAMSIYHPLDAELGNLIDAISGTEGAKENELQSLNASIARIDSASRQLMRLKVPMRAAGMHAHLLALVAFDQDTMAPMLQKLIEAKYTPEGLAPLQQELLRVEKRSTAHAKAVEKEQAKLQSTH